MEEILKGKKILITAGPVWVPIDRVRIITSIFGGRLGTIMAKTAQEMGAKVVLLMGPGRTNIEGGRNLNVIKFKYYDDLFALMEKEISSGEYDIVVHSAAVPDYVPERIFDGKIKSGKKNLTIKLKPTIKIIDCIKKWDPSVFLVKFKLQVDLKESELIEIAKKSMAASKADLIVANDLSEMKGANHIAFLVDQDSVKKVNTKDALAEELFRSINSKIKQ